MFDFGGILVSREFGKNTGELKFIEIDGGMEVAFKKDEEDNLNALETYYGSHFDKIE